MNTIIAALASRIGINSKIASHLADLSLFLTLLTMVPYDKEVMQLMPVAWTPYIIKAGMVSQIALRYLKSVLQKTESAEPIEPPILVKPDGTLR